MLIRRGDKLELLGRLLCATQTEDKANEGLNWMYLREPQGREALVGEFPACLRRACLHDPESVAPRGQLLRTPHPHPATPFFFVGCLWDFWQFQNV